MRPARKSPRHPVDISEEAGVRYLHFGSDWVQGAMRIARPWSLELEYTRDMMAGLLLRPPGQWPRRALLVGLGAGSLAKFIYRHLADCRLFCCRVRLAGQHAVMPGGEDGGCRHDGSAVFNVLPESEPCQN